MAQAPYSQGVPSVQPEVSGPSRYLNIPSTPAEFGGLIGAGEEKLGAGFTAAGKFYGEIAADQATNNWQEETTKILHGDPGTIWKDAQGNPILDQDGHPQADKGYLGLRGQQALDAHDSVIRRLNDARDRARGSLMTGDSALMFDQQTRYLHFRTLQEAGAHYDQQQNIWGQEVNKASMANALSAIAINPEDDTAFAAHTADATRSAIRNLSLLGLDRNNDAVEAAKHDTQQKATIARVEALMARGNTAKAGEILADPKNQEILGGSHYGLQQRIEHQVSAGNVDSLVHGAMAAGGAIPGAIAGEAARQDVDPELPLTTAEIESNFRPEAAAGSHVGIFQMGPNERAAVGGSRTEAGGPADQIQQGIASLAQRKIDLAAAIGRTPTNAEIYLAHQQGAAGAAALISNPSTPAGNLVPPANIRNNGGDPAAPAGQFVQKWQQEYQSRAQHWQQRYDQAAGSLTAGLDHIQNSPTGTPEEKDRARAKFDLQWRGEITNRARLEALDAKRVQALSDQRENEIIDDVSPGGPNRMTSRDITADTLPNGQPNPLKPEARIRMVRYLAQEAKPEALTAVSHETSIKLMGDIRDKKITDRGPIYDAYGNDKLTRADRDDLFKQLEDIRSPEGEKLAAERQKLLTKYAPLISHSNPLQGVRDPTGEANVYMYDWTIGQKIAEYRKAGKDPFDLFSPKNPDYVGSADFVRPFQTSFQHSLDIKTEGIEAPITPPSYPGTGGAPQRVFRLPGESIPAYKARTGGQMPPNVQTAPTGPAVAPPIR